MRSSYLIKGIVVCSGLALVLFAVSLSAQLYQRPAASPPDAAPPALVPVQPAPAGGGIHVQVGGVQVQVGGQDRILRASQLIGVNILGPDNQPLGSVKDFIVDDQGGCAALYFAMAPADALQLGQDYVILPYSAVEYRSDNRGAGVYFSLNVNGVALRNSPRIAINEWSKFNDRRVLGTARQFYQRTEHTTARPIEGGANQNSGQPDRRDGGNVPGTRPQPAPRPGTGLDPGNNPARPELAPPAVPNRQPDKARPPEDKAQRDATPKADRTRESDAPRQDRNEK